MTSPEHSPLSESALARAWADTAATQRSIKFIWLGEGVMAVAGSTWVSAIAPQGTSLFEKIWPPVAGALAGLTVAVALLVLFHLIRAPYRQRTEARRLARDWRRCLREQLYELVRPRETPIDLPEMMVALGLRHGDAESNRIVNEAILELQDLGRIRHVKRAGINGWLLLER